MALGQDLASSMSEWVMACSSGSVISMLLTRGESETSGWMPLRFSEMRKAAWLNSWRRSSSAQPRMSAAREFSS